MKVADDTSKSNSECEWVKQLFNHDSAFTTGKATTGEIQNQHSAKVFLQYIKLEKHLYLYNDFFLFHENIHASQQNGCNVCFLYIL